VQLAVSAVEAPKVTNLRESSLLRGDITVAMRITDKPSKSFTHSNSDTYELFTTEVGVFVWCVHSKRGIPAVCCIR